MLRGIGLNGNLVRAPVVFDLQAINICRTCPALRAAENDHWPAGAVHVAVLSCVLLIGEDLLDALIKSVRHETVHLGGGAALDKVRLPAAAAEEVLKLFMRNAREEGGVCNLVAVEVEYRQHGAVSLGVDEFVELPGSCERAGLCFAVADDAGCDEVWVIGHGAEGVGEGVAQLAALVDGTRGLGRNMGGDAAGERELLEELLHAFLVAGDVGVNLLIAAVQPILSDHGVSAVAGAGDIYHIKVIFFDNSVEVSVDKVLTGHGAPVADDLFLDALFGERFLQQRIVKQIKLAGGEIIGRAPICVQRGQLLLGCRATGFNVHVMTS